ncbi:putative alpha/beta superfamily hydrolase [Paenibacillus amylolyticus]|uniref:Alpha/beta superfamily hydrolase n=1 Tax=Paenibacillus amylolyticus TaxID=1451 RepID=A0AAP5H0R4_PAEAM|nr:alpha/beta hydrolase-fold protein [Paenibacillus amylolyticus]MDR6722861.1 putative alpha/beta superfamily hydrolase [Paenibacillus amylolyticus]
MTFQSKQPQLDAPEQENARSVVKIPRAEQWIMNPSTEGHAYQIMVYEPAEEAPASGYPVIYVLDANAVFGTMVEAVRLQGRRPEKTGVIPAIVVGIGYPTEATFSPHRYADYTPEATTEYTHQPDGTPLPPQGGADRFLQFIEDELKPRIEAQYRINRSRQAIFGHSLGGLFVLHTLLTKPEAFRYYIAGSPSLHWNQKLMQTEEEAFIARLDSDPIQAEVWIGIGEQEKIHPAGNNGRALGLTERLSSVNHPGLTIQFTEFEGENHVSVLPYLISRSLRMACHPETI